ncbi:MAG: putative CoA-binding protein [Salibacteraceae bacterium]|jgi:predicted CoA-binding protein
MIKFNTAVIGATPNTNRYSFKALTMLNQHGFNAIPLGFRKGNITGLSIITDWPKEIENLKVVTMYIGPDRQAAFYDYIIDLKPKTIIFNPGTENPEFYAKLDQSNIQYEEACTLVLLSTGAFENL